MKGLDATDFSYWSLLLWNTTCLLFCSSWRKRHLSVQWLTTRWMTGIRFGPRTFIRYWPRTFLISSLSPTSNKSERGPRCQEVKLRANLHVIHNLRQKRVILQSPHVFVFRWLAAQKSWHVVLSLLLLCTKILLRNDYTVLITIYSRLAWIRPR
jgi:hypothetical protein